jgi:hypothetical protein
MSGVPVQRGQPFGEGAAPFTPENDPNTPEDGRNDHNDDEGALTHGAKTIGASLNGP